LNQQKIKYNNTLFWALLVFFHLVVLCFLYQRFGFNYSNEGAKYIDQAKNLINGNGLMTLKYSSFYTFYVLYLSVFMYFKLPLVVIVICTYALSLYAYYCFYKLLKNSINSNVAKIWLVCMLLSPLIQYWQFNLFSETFFIALSLIYLSIFLAPTSSHRFLKIGVLSIALMLSRPNGIFIVLVAVILYLYQRKLISKKIVIYGSIYLGVILMIAIVFFMPLPYKDFSFQIASGAIYCGFPTLTATTLPEANYTLWNCYAYIYNTHGLSELLQLFIKKGLSFFVTSRPYYSSFHNVLNRAHDIFYVLGIIGTYNTYQYKKKWLPLIIALLLIVILNALMVSLIYNEWSERHTVQVFPYIFVGAACAIDLFLEKIKQTKIA
jgi:hypothetical protein